MIQEDVIVKANEEDKYEVEFDFGDDDSDGDLSGCDEGIDSSSTTKPQELLAQPSRRCLHP